MCGKNKKTIFFTLLINNNFYIANLSIFHLKDKFFYFYIYINN